MNKNDFLRQLLLDNDLELIQQAFSFADKKEGQQVINLTESYKLRVTNFITENNWQNNSIIDN